MGEVQGFTNFSIRPGVADCLADFDAFTARMNFEDFVKAVATIPDTEADAHFRSQYTFVTNHAGMVAVDFVGRYETLQSDLRHVQQRTNMPEFTLPRLQTAPDRVRYVDYYSTESRNAVAMRYRTDIELFDYAFDT